MDKDIKILPKIDFTPVQTEVAEGKIGEKKKYLDEYYSNKFLKDYFNH